MFKTYQTFLTLIFVIISCLTFPSVQDAQSLENKNVTKCNVPDKAPKNIEKVIETCQEEIKYSILTEALQSINVHDVGALQLDNVKTRRKRSFFTKDEQKIAGCLLQCVYRKKNALNAAGFPTLEGLVNLYTEGVTEKPYVLATIQAVHTCLNRVHTILDENPKKDAKKDKGSACDIAYKVFDCVSDMIEEYCGQTP